MRAATAKKVIELAEHIIRVTRTSQKPEIFAPRYARRRSQQTRKKIVANQAMNIVLLMVEREGLQFSKKA